MLKTQQSGCCKQTHLLRYNLHQWIKVLTAHQSVSILFLLPRFHGLICFLSSCIFSEMIWCCITWSWGIWSILIIFSRNTLNVWLQAYCVFMFLAAVSLFGTLISQLNEILSSSSFYTRQLHRNFAAYLELRPRNGSFDTLIAKVLGAALFLFSFLSKSMVFSMHVLSLMVSQSQLESF